MTNYIPSMPSMPSIPNMPNVPNPYNLPKMPSMPKPSSGSGTSQFDLAKMIGGISALEQKILGPGYDYAGHIKSPGQMGMSGDGNFDALGDNINGILGYVELLVGGQCKMGKCASKNLDGSTFEGPLGNQFFLDTSVKCKDIASGKPVTRSLYVNNIPDGRIPIISDMGGGVTFDEFKGIMPGIMSNIAQINPMQILSAFTAGANAPCQLVTMPTYDAIGHPGPGVDSRYVTNSDIGTMPSNWFPGSAPKSKYNLTPPKESFCNRSDIEGSPIDYSKMPNDALIKMYYSMLGLFGLYIILRLMLKNKL
jgi:hypothetical protein